MVCILTIKTEDKKVASHLQFLNAIYTRMITSETNKIMIANENNTIFCWKCLSFTQQLYRRGLKMHKSEEMKKT